MAALQVRQWLRKWPLSARNAQIDCHWSTVYTVLLSYWLNTKFRLTCFTFSGTASSYTHTHIYTCTNSLYFCYTAASGAENKKSRFVLACFLPLLPLSSVFSPSLSFLLLLPFHPYLVSFFPPTQVCRS